MGILILPVGMQNSAFIWEGNLIAIKIKMRHPVTQSLIPLLGIYPQIHLHKYVKIYVQGCLF